jgi:hypothetical protein
MKLVALFLLVFTLGDVSLPETCLEEGLGIAARGTQVQTSHQDGGRGGCQFEEDCLACAHILPGTHYVLDVTQVVTFAEPELYLTSQGGIPPLLYHPPRP